MRLDAPTPVCQEAPSQSQRLVPIKKTEILMKSSILSVIAGLALAAGGVLSAAADDLAALAGKWVAELKDGEGRPYKQTREINQNKFKFQASRGEDGGGIFAEGEVKTEQLGPFKAAKFFNMRAG